MIAKKNSGVDLERKKSALFTIGLLAAGSFTLAAFTYQSPTLIEEQKNTVSAQDINYVVEKTAKKIPITHKKIVLPTSLIIRDSC